MEAACHHRSFTLMCTPESLRVPYSAGHGVELVRARPDETARCARLWREVGAGFWTERHEWDDARWARRLSRPAVSFWIARVSDEDAGCFELTRAGCGTRIEGFGLLPAFRGRGLGRALLTAATECAFADGAPRVWLHTATDDHPAALPNYLAGGYRVVRERELLDPMPARGRAGGGDEEHEVVVVLDLELGAGLLELVSAQHVWLRESPANLEWARRVPTARPGGWNDAGVTTFRSDCSAAPERALVEILVEVDLHHGALSHDPPWTRLRVIGACPTAEVRGALARYGVRDIEPRAAGFVARRPRPAE